ncbi:MAG: ABC transporter substrate-binding protein [Pseudomonadota bacterium]
MWLFIPRAGRYLSAHCFYIVALAVLFAPAAAQAEPSAQRVVALGGSVTEIVHALGHEDRLVGRDSTSTYPAEVMDLPDVGYVRALSPEGVLSIAPDLILAIEGSGPPEAVEVLQAADIPWVTVPDGYDAEAIREKIRIVAQALGEKEAGDALADAVEAALSDAMTEAVRVEKPRVLFVLSLQGGRIMAAGHNTGAEGIIDLSGAQNAMAGFDGYKQVSDEAVLLAQPDVILMMDRGGSHAVTDEFILSHPVLGQTPAAETTAIVRLPGLLMLGFGPRTPEAVRALSKAYDRVIR